MNGTVAIIPARGGSKRIPRKNIKPFLGKPIITYAIEACINSNIFDRIIVSTDDEEIAEIAKKHGAEVPFLRSAENANDYATLFDVVVEVTQNLKQEDSLPEVICCILPTAALIDAYDLNSAFTTFLQNGSDSLFPVVAFSYPIQRALLKTKSNKIELLQPEYKNTRSQDLDTTFHDSGTFYFANTKALLEHKTFFYNSAFYEVSELSVQDIDTETDWKLAELKYQLKNSVS